MDKRQKEKQTMGKKLLFYIDENGTVYLGYTDYTDEIAIFRTVLDDWDDLEADESIHLGGALDAKTPLKQNAADFWAMVISTARIWALKPANNLLELAKDLDQTGPEIFKLGDNACANRCKHFYDVLNPLVGTMTGTGIDAPLMLEGQGITNAFKAKIGTPKVAINEKNSIGTQIENLITLRFEPSLENLRGMTHGIFFRNKKDYVEGFDLNTAIDELPTEHTKVTVTILDGEGHPIRYATLKELKSGKTGTADSAGIAYVEEFTAGKDTDFLIKAVGFENYSFTKDITTGEKYSYSITMIAVPPPPPTA